MTCTSKVYCLVGAIFLGGVTSDGNSLPCGVINVKVDLVGLVPATRGP